MKIIYCFAKNEGLMLFFTLNILLESIKLSKINFQTFRIHRFLPIFIIGNLLLFPEHPLHLSGRCEFIFLLHFPAKTTHF